MTTREKLIEAKKLLEVPGAWGQSLVSPGCELPEDKLCAGLALDMVEDRNDGGEVHNIFEAVIGTNEVPIWNDSHTYQEVLAAFDEAIKEAERGQEE